MAGYNSGSVTRNLLAASFLFLIVRSSFVAATDPTNKPDDDQEIQITDFGEAIPPFQDTDGTAKLTNEKRNLDSGEGRIQEVRQVPLPKSAGFNIEAIAGTLPRGVKLRQGQALNTDTCTSVRSVPAHMRDPAQMDGQPINSFYQKYTEAYGIHIIGSANVTDCGLRRACYVIRFLLASRYDVRNAIYKFNIRVGLIGDGEQMTTLPEYNNLGPDWNTRVRGLGPTIHIPMTSAGDDNMRCLGSDRYFDQDILIHEFSHTVEILGASYTIPGFRKRLVKYFYDNKETGLWGSTYAGSTPHEYFAVASQFYFDSFRYPGSYLSRYGVKNRDTLREYDPKIAALLDEVHSCAASGKNKLVHRCNWNNCSSENFALVLSSSMFASSQCPAVARVSNVIQDLDACAVRACRHGANVFNFKGTKCQVLKCNKTETIDDMQIVQGRKSFDIYKIVREPVMDLSAEKKQRLVKNCNAGPTTSACAVSSADRVACGWSKIREKSCRRIGCCYASRRCFYPKQDCSDSHYLCPEIAGGGGCEYNPGFMLRKCQLSCNVCDLKAKINSLSEKLSSMCQDKQLGCKGFAKLGYCTGTHKAYMKSFCRLSCGLCTPPSYPL